MHAFTVTKIVQNVPNPFPTKFQQTQFLSFLLVHFYLPSGEEILVRMKHHLINLKNVDPVFSSSSTTRVMSLYYCKKANKFFNHSMLYYFPDIQSTCDENEDNLIYLNCVKGQYDTISVVICTCHSVDNWI